MNIKASDGRTYSVTTAPPGGAHEVSIGGTVIGSFVLDTRGQTHVTVKMKPATPVLLTDIAERFVAEGGAPMGIA